MLFGRDSFTKKNMGKYIIGYDLSNRAAQISYLEIGKEQPETLSLVAGAEVYDIPMELYKREEDNQWFIGKEAVKCGEELGGPLFSNLLEAAYRGEMVELWLEPYYPVALLALFVKRSLSLLSFITPPEEIAAMMFTVETLDSRMVAVLREMVEYLQLPEIPMQFISKEESFYYYNLHTEESLWREAVSLYEMQGNCLHRLEISLNRMTVPKVFLVKKETYPALKGAFPEKEEEKARWDEQFLNILEGDLAEKKVSTVYLIGDGFRGEWYQRSIRFLCQDRRVFRGNNLYSKGACHAMLDKLSGGKLMEEYVYLGADKLLSNIGMEVLRQGEKSYLAVLDGGNSWYDCKKDWDVILEKSNRLEFRITPLNGKNATEAALILNGLPQQKRPYSRVHIEVQMQAADKMRIRVQDKGFGEFFPATDRMWEEEFEV